MKLSILISRCLIFPAFVLLLSSNLAADSLPVSEWLVVSGPRPDLPAFSETKNIKGESFTAEDLFKLNPVDLNGHYPEYNKVLISEREREKKWSTAGIDDSGFVNLERTLDNSYERAYLAAYITIGRWMEVELEISSPQMMEVYLNGTNLGFSGGSEKVGSEPKKFTREVELSKGKHLLVIHTFIKEKDENPWQIKGMINLPSYSREKDATVEINPKQGKNINHLLDGIKAGLTTLSPDAKFYAVNYRRTLPPSDRSENWLEIKRVSDSKIVHSFRHASIHAFSWAPEKNIISYRTTRENKSTIWIYDLDTGDYFALLEDVEDFGSYSWSPDGSFLIYSIKEEVPDNEGDLNRLLGMRDRIPGYRTRFFLYRVDIESGIKERLTHGFLTTSLHDISPCGKMILFSQSRPDYRERPYSRQDVFLMDLATKKADTLFKDMQWSVSGQFSPDGKQLLFTGGPSAFGSKGENIPEGMIANNYDTQAYIYDLKKNSADPFTRQFAPSISQAAWSRSDNFIYLVAGDEDYVHLFRYNTKDRSFTKIDTGKDVINWIRLSGNEPYATYSGSGMSSPPRVSLLDLNTGSSLELENTEKHNYRNVVFGENMEWDFENSEGIRIPGRVYLPEDFDESKQYPLIVYYYGGTNPVSRSFGGRYPFNMYAANGYVVYVLQPSGATGFGQEFSARHVNNWGRTVADEIIRGTTLFLDDHSFIDPERVGCMGASYGGFMTMLLQTRTDIFAAAISHAGISSISSYWGQGYWGYGYSAVASAGSFPWNNRELYVDQSPLFSADRITTPLLLLHGSSDTNVPPGESIQMYTALKLLGKPVELIKIEQEDHHILTYSKRIAWSNTKLAWFDKWLKEQPEWWENIYPEKNY